MTQHAATGDAIATRVRRWRTELSELMGGGFLQNVTGTFGSRMLLLVLGILSSVVVARVLGPDGRGTYAAAFAIGAIGVQIGNLGLHSSNTWLVARDKSLVGILIANSLAVSAVVGGSILVVGVAMHLAWPSLFPVPRDMLVLALVSVPVGLAYLLLQNLLLGTERIRPYNLIDIGSRSVSVVALVLLAAGGAMTPVSAYAVYVVMAAVAGLVAYRVVSHRVSVPAAPSKTILFEGGRYGLKAYVASLLAFLVLRIDVLIVQSIRGPEDAGYYSVAATVADQIYIFPAVVGALLFVRLSATIDADRRSRLTRTATLLMAVVMTLGAAISVAVAEPIIGFLYGPAFMPSVDAFIWLMPGIVFLSVNTMLVNLFAAEGMLRVAIVGSLLGLLANIALNIALIPDYGIVGASVASTVAYGLMLSTSLTYLWRRRRGRLSV